MLWFDGSDDFVWAGGPDQGLWVILGLFDAAIDGGLQEPYRIDVTKFGHVNNDPIKSAVNHISSVTG